MAKKNDTIYICQECGAESPRWHGRCFSCNAWNSFVEKNVTISSTKSTRNLPPLEVKSLAEIQNIPVNRTTSSLEGVDRVLGGGLVPGSAIILGGEPGSGKSTLLLQYAASIKTGSVYYLSGEESVEQIGIRAKRLAIDTDDLKISNLSSVDQFFSNSDLTSNIPALLIIDSIQTISDAQIESKTGSLSQVQSVVQRLVEYAKSHKVPVIMVGHVTKGGNLAGPKTVEHLVDVVLYLEGESEHKVLHSVKNRFGSVNEVALFDFTTGKFEDKVPAFWQDSQKREGDQIGAVATIVKEGGRFVPLEIQALVSQSYVQNPRRVITGYDYNRVLMLIAILEKYTNNKFFRHDVFVNVSEGIRIYETSADLAISIALVSSLRKKPIPLDIAAWGEVSLLGQIGKSSQSDQRIKEAKRYGYEKLVTSEKYSNIQEALKVLGWKEGEN